MASRSQHATSSLSRYASPRGQGSDPFNGSRSREFCNSFWGPGDEGPNILFKRMRNASKTTDELVNFWNERSLIEEEYALKLAKLAKAPIGSDEIGELKTCLDTLRLETEKQAESHLELARQVREELETPTAEFHARQVAHRRNQQSALEKKHKNKQTQEAYVQKAREKYESDCERINSFTQQASYMTGKDLERINMKLLRARQTVQANEKDLANFSKTLFDMLPEWEAEWKNFCDSCQDIEEERLEFMKDILWAYANDLSTICVADDQSCERVRTALDQLDPPADMVNFVNDYGTGNSIHQPAEFVPFIEGTPAQAGTGRVRQANFVRMSVRPQAPYLNEPGQDQHVAEVPPPAAPVSNGVSQQPVHQSNGRANGHTSSGSAGSHHQGNPYISAAHKPSDRPSTRSSAPTAATPRNRQSGPLPVIPGGFRSSSPPPPMPQMPQQPQNQPEPDGSGGNPILFYVKALYDYTATIPEEFDFQSGDVIAVTATPDDGWWSGELLDETRKVPGRHVFPSNFVCLF
ncbi:SH3 domain-containing protein [Ephemerocybe angulata]|uniref:SH3 domain-containing protein n=1 Tax=Ephemerocybe angulata TaxID=980116 RepID=A0A8H6MDL5_9AGAR|nr:SH3 domain-containing protein [Tulosesus angulatus]